MKRRIDMDEFYRCETRERFQRAERSFNFNREMDVSK